MSLVMAGLLAFSAWVFLFYESPDELAAKARVEELSAELADANNEIDERLSDIALLEAHISTLTDDLAEKLLEIEQLEYDVDVLLEKGVESDEYQAILQGRISDLRAQVEARLDEIAQLRDLIENYENITTLNFGYQAKKVSELLIMLAEQNRPTRTVKREIRDEATGEVIETVRETVASNVSFYYQDITTGYTLSCNSADVMYSASLIKAPYIYVLLKSVADFEDAKYNYDSEGAPLYDKDGNPLFDGAHPNLDEDGHIIYLEGEEKFDLSRVWTFDKKTMMREGSGMLRDMEDGTELTYLELVEYALLYSDNIAFYELCQLFGYVDYYSAARRLGIQGISSGFMQLSAADCARFMTEIYAFTEENETYGAFMKDAMIRSNYPVLIPYSVSPTVAAHKYGWDVDAYHDMAIVYDEHPYILVLMTDLDTGGTSNNSYIQQVVRAIHSIHQNFYAS